MKHLKNKVVIALVSALVGFGVGFFSFGSPELVSTISTGTSQTFSSAKIAGVGFSPTTASATTSVVLLNSDSTDRIIESWFAACSTLGTSRTYLVGDNLAALTFTFGTTTNTSNSNPASTANVAVLTIATSTPDGYVASSTNPFPNPVGRTWASGTYLLINSNATNTASCVAGVHYLAS